jgi:hypothetical protein
MVHDGLDDDLILQNRRRTNQIILSARVALEYP